MSLQRTLIVWWRFVHEHGEDDVLRVNDPTVVDAHIRGKVEEFRQTRPSYWRWFEASRGLLVERSAQDEIMYYLPSRNWLIMQRDNHRRGDSWRWYIHIGDTEWSSRYEAWVFKDHFKNLLQTAGVRVDLQRLPYVKTSDVDGSVFEEEVMQGLPPAEILCGGCGQNQKTYLPDQPLTRARVMHDPSAVYGKRVTHGNNPTVHSYCFIRIVVLVTAGVPPGFG